MTELDFSPKTLRSNIIRMAKDSKSGHLGCAMSLVEIVSTLYGSVLNYNRKDPKDSKRDLLALSKGHGVMALYSAFFQLGWISDSQVDNYLKDGTDLFGLAEDHIPGIEISGGSLGHGFPVAVGMAYGLQRDESEKKVYCIVGDGEINEGSVWEAILFAGHHKLKNLTLIIDANQYQAMGLTKDILDLEPLDKKFEAFGFTAITCDGHNLTELENAFVSANNSDLPSVIIARTTKGAGISFMENENIWHYKKMTKEEENVAINEIGASK